MREGLRKKIQTHALGDDRCEGEAWRHGPHLSYRWRPSRS
jgi:hypothetical protein